MFRKGALRTATILLGTLAGPPAAVWTSARVVDAFRPPPPRPERVVRFTDYMSQTDVSAVASLSEGKQLWAGKPGTTTPFFRAMRLSRNAIVLISDERLVAIDARSDAVLRDAAIEQQPALAALGAMSLAAAEQPDQVWVYSRETGQLV
jgi:hypothetical protein